MATRTLTAKLWRLNANLVSKQQLRQLTLHEYQSQNLLKEFGIPVPRGHLARTPAEAAVIATELGGNCSLKSQILRGGIDDGAFDNGSGAGIQLVNNAKSAEKAANRMLGHYLKTDQSVGNGVLVNKLHVTESLNPERKWYLAITFDRENYCPIIIASKFGGVAIEKIAAQHPDELHTFRFGFTDGITSKLTDKVSNCLGASAKEKEDLNDILGRLYKIFTTKDAYSLEIKTLASSSEGGLTCMDAKFSFDDAAAKRQKPLFAERDTEHEIPEEVEAEKYGLVYVRMDGDIGNVVNGAGLAMATNDAIALHGGASANFLDAGGQATKETMVKAFEIILRDRRVKTIFVNIYGGITRGDMIAESILGAAKELGPLKIPMVVRLQGTNSEMGLKIPDLDPIAVADFHDTLKKSKRIVALIGAGLSVSSGLATFRGANGLWRNQDITQVASPAGFRHDPGLVWQFYTYRRHDALRAKPNPAHYALAELARRVPGFVALTQNVDNLSRRAGHSPSQLKELHGNLFALSCVDVVGCGHTERDNFEESLSPALDPSKDEERTIGSINPDKKPRASPVLLAGIARKHAQILGEKYEGNSPTTRDLTALKAPDQPAPSDPVAAIRLSSGLEKKDLPQCHKCKNNILRPAVVWFGEPLPVEVVEEAQALFDDPEAIDLFLTIGTTSKVWPAAGYAEMARKKGARVAVINTRAEDARHVRPDKDWVFVGDAAVVLPQLLKPVISESYEQVEKNMKK
ncbi:NAD-dependent deacetylase sirtuin-5 [Colletotrichum tamarilloi]|uniref:NAD-dependent deacetylase sirtuin-5 n=1 Tax=Colletotrichum tamarilloi TaxID=1209934 RepID=A0ABQ9R2D6_9PEZI|nr:NAD-dependent deacetylase sirtuin-5 [Colletotrichum tamarilloi]KAK1492745.1 NAD-dependent deacetylase sirtuin-5 [Colletotrichum tamarilloi]